MTRVISHSPTVCPSSSDVDVVANVDYWVEESSLEERVTQESVPTQWRICAGTFDPQILLGRDFPFLVTESEVESSLLCLPVVLIEGISLRKVVFVVNAR